MTTNPHIRRREIRTVARVLAERCGCLDERGYLCAACEDLAEKALNAVDELRNRPRLCAHADHDGKGMHWMNPGETCQAAKPDGSK